MSIKKFIIIVLSYYSIACLSSASTENGFVNLNKHSPKLSPTPRNSVEVRMDENSSNPQNTTNFIDFDDEKLLKSVLTGKWSRIQSKNLNSCDEFIKIDFSKSADFCVESNQIYINARYKLNSENKKLYLFLIKPTDLGRGGLGLSWENYDHRRPIAAIDISELQENKIHLKWIGFYEKKAKRTDDYGNGYEGIYQKEPDNKFFQDEIFRDLSKPSNIE